MVKSPCQNKCKLDNRQEYCVTCFRTVQEIKNWSKLRDPEKWWILDDIALVRSIAYGNER